MPFVNLPVETGIQLPDYNDFQKDNGFRLEAGKNSATARAQEINGRYIPNDAAVDETLFVKKPESRFELFTEYFAGSLLRKFIEKGLVPAEYHDCFVTAGLMANVPGENSIPGFALSQPFVEFTELHRVLGTTNYSNTDRSGVYECGTAMLGYLNYSEIPERLPNHFGLAYTLMMSLFIGDYSVHSANLAFINEDDGKTNRIIRFDFGAAFRDIARQETVGDILLAYECQQSFLNYMTKSYVHQYSGIDNIFYDISQNASELLKAGKEKVYEAVLDALNEVAIIVDNTPDEHLPLVDEGIAQGLADYTGIPEFKNAFCSGDKKTIRPLADKLSDILLKRLLSLQALEESYPNTKHTVNELAYKKHQVRMFCMINLRIFENKHPREQFDNIECFEKTRQEMRNKLELFERVACEILDRNEYSKDQKYQLMKKLSYKLFGVSKTTYGLRLFADALLMITVIGMFYQAYRRFKQGKTWFVSNEKTTMEKDIENIFKPRKNKAKPQSELTKNSIFKTHQPTEHQQDPVSVDDASLVLP